MTTRPGLTPLKSQILFKQKIRAYRRLYEFTKSACGDCARTDCACKDSICSHVQTQARLSGIEIPETGKRLRFLGCDGCVVPPHLRETCTIYLCEPAQNHPKFAKQKYDRLKNICAKIDEKLMMTASFAPQNGA